MLKHRLLQHAEHKDCELNLAPIIDCFTVLIAYMLVSASFMSTKMFDITQIPDSASEQSVDPNAQLITVSWRIEGGLEIALSGPVTRTELASDAKDLKVKMQALKTEFSTVTRVAVASRNSTKYKDLVAVLEVIKTAFPHVAFGSASEPEVKVESQ